VQAAFGSRRLVHLSLAAILMSFGAAAAENAAAGGAAEFDQGQRLAAICASCHDPDGTNRGIPPIAGLEEKKITEAMARYRESEEPSIVMHAIALSLTEEEVASVAHYLAAHGKAGAP
jgi:cytochrome c553